MDVDWADFLGRYRPLALRIAQLAQKQGGTLRVHYAHPFFWSGYVFVAVP